MTRSPLLASLGSSFAAGPGIAPVADPAAMRSARNYPHLLADLLGADLVDLSVSGATTATILDTVQVMPGAEFPPQLDGLPEGADIVTITAGGNDIAYVGSMMYSALIRADPGSPMIGMLGDTFAQGIPTPTLERAAVAAGNLVRIVEAARARAPRAEVVLVDYATVIDDDHDENDDELPFRIDDLNTLRTLQRNVISMFAMAADAAGTRLVRASALTVGHGLGATEPWVFGFDAEPRGLARSFHPNELGMRAVASAIARELGG